MSLWLASDNSSHSRLSSALIFAYAVTIPLEGIQLAIGTLPYVPAAALVLLAVSRTAQRHPTMSIGPPVGIALLFLTWTCGSYWWSIDPADSARRVVTIGALVAVFVAIAVLYEERTTIWAIRGLAIGGLIAGAYLITQYAAARELQALEIRPTAVGANANDLGAVLAIAAVSTIAAAHHARSIRERWATLAVSLALIFFTLLTASRSALLALIVGLAVVLVSQKRRFLRLFGYLSVGGISVFALREWIDPRITERLLSTGEAVSSGDFNNRRTLWTASWNAWEERPVGGWGAGTSGEVLMQRLGEEDASHNAWLNVMVELGLVGVVCFIVLWVSSLREIARFRQRSMYLGLLAPTLLASLTLTWDYRKILWLTLALVAAQGMMQCERKRTQAAGQEHARASLGQSLHTGWEVADRRGFPAPRPNKRLSLHRPPEH